jgi:hypothetical protein
VLRDIIVAVEAATLVPIVSTSLRIMGLKAKKIDFAMFIKE